MPPGRDARGDARRIRTQRTIIAGAYTDRSGGVCPMLAAHRNGSRVSFLPFARAWDAYARARRPRPATERELHTLVHLLEASLAEARRTGFAAITQNVCVRSAIDAADARTPARSPATDADSAAQPRATDTESRARRPATDAESRARRPATDAESPAQPPATETESPSRRPATRARRDSPSPVGAARLRPGAVRRLPPRRARAADREPARSG